METNILKDRLEILYNKYNNKKFIFNDPVEFPHRYKNEEDVLLIGFIAAIFSYGRVSLFKKILEEIFKRLENYPARYLREADDNELKKISYGIQYRFYNSSDIEILFYILRGVLRKKKITDFFEYSLKNDDTISSISKLRKDLLSQYYDNNISNISDGIRFMFPDPSSGSSLKRFFMFLRWMVRKDEIDFGIINSIKPNQLIIPLDTHIANIARLLKMTRRRSNDIKCAKEITDYLRDIEPDDPIKYDFALAHTGITDGCRHKFISSICKDCLLSVFCDNKKI